MLLDGLLGREDHVLRPVDPEVGERVRPVLLLRRPLGDEDLVVDHRVRERVVLLQPRADRGGVALLVDDLDLLRPVRPDRGLHLLVVADPGGDGALDVLRALDLLPGDEPHRRLLEVVGDRDERQLLLLAGLQEVVGVVHPERDAAALGLRHHPVDGGQSRPPAHDLDVEALEEPLLHRRRRAHRLVVDEPGLEDRHLGLVLREGIGEAAPRRKAGEDDHQGESEKPQRSHHRRVLLGRWGV